MWVDKKNLILFSHDPKEAIFMIRISLLHDNKKIMLGFFEDHIIKYERKLPNGNTWRDERYLKGLT